MSIVDDRGNHHHAAGAPGAGQFASKGNTAPNGALTTTAPAIRDYATVLAAAQEAGKIGSPPPKDAHPHLGDIRHALWWAARFGAMGELSTEDEVRREIANAEQYSDQEPSTLERLQASNHALRWVLGEVDNPYLP